MTKVQSADAESFDMKLSPPHSSYVADIRRGAESSFEKTSRAMFSYARAMNEVFGHTLDASELHEIIKAQVHASIYGTPFSEGKPLTKPSAYERIHNSLAATGGYLSAISSLKDGPA